MHEVIPGILERDWVEIERKIELVKPFTHSIHIDLIDGSFAPNPTFLDPKPFKKYTKDIFFELHMMVEEPEGYLEDWARAGFRRFIGHIEQMSNQQGFVDQAERLGEVGLAVDVKSGLEAIRVEHQDLDTVLVMTVKAGFSNQKFLPESLTKVEELTKKDLFPVEIDGGVNSETLKQGLLSGANRFVSTGFIFSAGYNPQEQYQKLLEVTGGLV